MLTNEEIEATIDCIERAIKRMANNAGNKKTIELYKQIIYDLEQMKEVQFEK